jgi:hypothetical protein
MNQPWFPSSQCAPAPCPPPWPPCPPPTFSPPTPPWYPGANAGVSFGTQFPPNPCRGHFLWDGSVLWIWDGVAWDKIGPAAPGTAGIPEAPIDGNLYGRENAAWMKVVMPVATGVLVAMNIYSGSQTIVIPTGVTKGYAQMWGATGGSGGANNTTSGGTGAGGYLEKLLTGLVAGSTLTFSQGAAGTAGAIAGAGGNAGVTTLSSGTQTIGTLTCTGSNGSAAGVTGSVTALGTPGGTASGGDINLTGQTGASAVPSVNEALQPPGGVTFFSAGANGISPPAGAPGNPGNPGGLKILWFA